MGTDPGAGSKGRREEVSSLQPPNWTPSSDPHKHPSFLAFLRARACCPPLKYKKLHPAPSPLGAGIGLEQRLAPPGRGRLEKPPGRGQLSVIMPSVWLPTGGRSQGRSGLAGADCLSPCALPARAWPPQGCGAPSGSPQVGSAPSKLAAWLLPLVLLDRESRLRPLTSQFFLLTLVTPGSELPLCFQGNLEQTDQSGVGGWGTSFHLRFLEGTGEPSVPGLLSFCVILQQSEDGGG